MKNQMMSQMMNQMMNQSQVQMGSCAIKGFDESLSGAPKIWYEDNHHVAIKVAPNDTFATVASALQTTIQKKSDENAPAVNPAMAAMSTSNPAMKAMANFSSTTTVLGFSFEGTEISLTSDGQQPISSRLAVGDVFQIKVQYDIQMGQGGGSGKTTTASAQQQQPNPDMQYATSSTGAIQPGGASCCIIL
jgi:hypothetical protein